MKKRKFKSWVKDTLMVVCFGAFLVGIIVVNNNITNEFITNCENAGYTHNYCVSQS